MRMRYDAVLNQAEGARRRAVLGNDATVPGAPSNKKTRIPPPVLVRLPVRSIRCALPEDDIPAVRWGRQLKSRNHNQDFCRCEGGERCSVSDCMHAHAPACSS